MTTVIIGWALISLTHKRTHIHWEKVGHGFLAFKLHEVAWKTEKGGWVINNRPVEE